MFALRSLFFFAFAAANLFRHKHDLSDYYVISTLGSTGSFLLAQDLSSKQLVVLEKFNKHIAAKTDGQCFAETQRKILANLSNPFIVGYVTAFQDDEFAFLVMELAKGSDLSKLGTFTNAQTKYIAAQIVLGLEYLRKNRIMHRELEPANVVLASDGYLKLVGFDYAMRIEHKSCGNVPASEFSSPEIVKNLPQDFTTDYWSLGAVIYALLTGSSPFHAQKEYLTLQRIAKGEYLMNSFIEDDAADLIRKLLVVDPKKRLGAKSIEEIKSHNFFERINWNKLAQHRAKSPNFTRAVNDNSSDSDSTQSEISFEGY